MLAARFAGISERPMRSQRSQFANLAAHLLDALFPICSNPQIEVSLEQGAHLGAFPNMRFFRLSDGSVQCSEDGLFVGSVPMLIRSSQAGRGEFWTVRAGDELDRDLGECYGLPIDVASKRASLEGVARALNRGEMALAKIAAVLLGFPDPPSLTKGAPTSGSVELATQLFWSGLLKGDWDPDKHPRTGEPPNRGWFAPREDKGELSEPEPEKPPSTLDRGFLRSLRDIVKAEVWTILETEQFLHWTSAFNHRVEAAIAVFETLSLAHRMQAAQRAIETARASLDPPKTLVELQTPPTQNILGYDLHHIVEQNPDNILKSPVEVIVEKFGRNLIDSPSNLVWIPRLKHELITGYYNSKVSDDGPLRRQVVNAGDFETQREAGLAALRRFGVLQ
jgi:hypothetical protein